MTAARVQVSGPLQRAVAGRLDRLRVQGRSPRRALPPRQRVEVNANHRAPGEPALQQRNAGAAHRVQHRIARSGQSVDEIAGQPVRKAGRERMQRMESVSGGRLPRRRPESQVGAEEGSQAVAC